MSRGIKIVGHVFMVTAFNFALSGQCLVRIIAAPQGGSLQSRRSVRAPVQSTQTQGTTTSPAGTTL